MTSSEEEIERLKINLESTQKNSDTIHKAIMDKLDDFSTDFNTFKLEVTKSLAELPEKLSEKFDQRYADKRTENYVRYAIFALVTFGVILGLSLLLRTPIGLSL